MTKDEVMAMLARFTREDGDCLIWTGSTTNKGHPMYRKRTVRQWVWEADNPPLPRSMVVSCTCGRPLCVAHLEARTKARVVREAVKRPDVVARKVAGGHRAKAIHPRTKLTQVLADEVRSLKGRAELVDVAVQYGISASTVKKVWSGERWVPLQQQRNPFAGLFSGLAANEGRKRA